MTKAVYPGSFDILTLGHLDIIRRAAKMFDEVHVLVSVNLNKKYIFNAEERIQMIKDSTANIKNLVITSYDGLVVNYCKDNEIKIIVRGMRNFADYENEFTLFQYNKDIYNEVDTVILMPTTKNQVVSSSAVKELVAYGCDIKKYVPAPIAERIINKFNN